MPLSRRSVAYTGKLTLHLLAALFVVDCPSAAQPYVDRALELNAADSGFVRIEDAAVDLLDIRPEGEFAITFWARYTTPEFYVTLFAKRQYGPRPRYGYQMFVQQGTGEVGFRVDPGLVR